MVDGPVIEVGAVSVEVAGVGVLVRRFIVGEEVEDFERRYGHDV